MEVVLKNLNKTKEYILNKFNNLRIDNSDPVKWGFIFTSLFFGVFGFWACFAPINSAAVTQGSIVLNANKKVIQHLEGGIIEGILVKEGDFVEKDQELIKLSQTLGNSNLNLLYNKLRALVARETRLLAEQRGKPRLEFIDPLLDDKNNAAIKKILDSQVNLFTSRMQTLSYRINILEKQIIQVKEEIFGLNAQKKAIDEQLILLQKEKQVVSRLVDGGHETQPRLFALQRSVIELRGNKGDLISKIAKAKQSINQIKLEILDFKNERIKEVSLELNEVRIKINDLHERVIAAEDVSNRLIIKSPYSGIVTNLKFHTKHGVISPHTEIMTIVPQDDELIIEAKLNIQDIDVVSIDQDVNIRLSAYKSRYVPKIKGMVKHISPDKLLDPMSRMPYYLVKIKINNVFDKTVMFKNKKIELYPGMPAEVFIVTGRRTFLSYLLDPIKKTFRRSFREE